MLQRSDKSGPQDLPSKLEKESNYCDDFSEQITMESSNESAS